MKERKKRLKESRKNSSQAKQYLYWCTEGGECKYDTEADTSDEVTIGDWVNACERVKDKIEDVEVILMTLIDSKKYLEEFVEKIEQRESIHSSKEIDLPGYYVSSSPEASWTKEEMVKWFESQTPSWNSFEGREKGDSSEDNKTQQIVEKYGLIQFYGHNYYSNEDKTLTVKEEADGRWRITPNTNDVSVIGYIDFTEHHYESFETAAAALFELDNEITAFRGLKKELTRTTEFPMDKSELVGVNSPKELESLVEGKLYKLKEEEIHWKSVLSLI